MERCWLLAAPRKTLAYDARNPKATFEVEQRKLRSAMLGTNHKFIYSMRELFITARVNSLHAFIAGEN